MAAEDLTEEPVETELKRSPNHSVKRRKYDPREEIFARNEQEMLKYQTQFRESILALRGQLIDLMKQSDDIGNQMLDRIVQLKSQIKAIKDREEFCKRKVVTLEVEVTKRPRKSKSKAKKAKPLKH